MKNIATRTYRYQSCQTLVLKTNQNETTTIAGDPGDPSDPEADPEADPQAGDPGDPSDPDDPEADPEADP